MSKMCDITGKKVQFGHNVSKANNKTKRKFYPNIKEVSLTSEILKRNIKVKLSARALKAVDFKGGLDEYLLKAKNKNLSPKIKKLRKIIISKNK